MAIQNTTHVKTTICFPDRKMLAIIIRVTLLSVICIYGIHVASSLTTTPSSDAPRARISMKQRATPFVPIVGKWNFKTQTSRSESRLLPIPEPAHTLCNRTAASGSVQMEIVTLNSTRQQLLEYWRNAGWNVRPAPHQRSGYLACFCTRGDELVYAWAEEKNHRIKSLMLVNHPNQGSDNTVTTLRNSQ